TLITKFRDVSMEVVFCYVQRLNPILMRKKSLSGEPRDATDTLSAATGKCYAHILNAVALDVIASIHGVLHQQRIGRKSIQGAPASTGDGLLDFDMHRLTVGVFRPQHKILKLRFFSSFSFPLEDYYAASLYLFARFWNFLWTAAINNQILLIMSLFHETMIHGHDMIAHGNELGEVQEHAASYASKPLRIILILAIVGTA
ncbi:hypothetical protein ACJX0J_023286, partial [Zea mays]